jgi:6-pyruvoyl-tetrahydropterin synthase
MEKDYKLFDEIINGWMLECYVTKKYRNVSKIIIDFDKIDIYNKFLFSMLNSIKDLTKFTPKVKCNIFTYFYLRYNKIVPKNSRIKCKFAKNAETVLELWFKKIKYDNSNYDWHDLVKDMYFEYYSNKKKGV